MEVGDDNEAQTHCPAHFYALLLTRICIFNGWVQPGRDGGIPLQVPFCFLGQVGGLDCDVDTILGRVPHCKLRSLVFWLPLPECIVADSPTRGEKEEENQLCLGKSCSRNAQSFQEDA